MKVAIVGSEEKYWTPAQRTKVVKEIKKIFLDIGGYNEFTVYVGDKFDPTKLILVSGGCPKGGVDIWAEIVADVLGVEKEIYLPEVNQWPDGVEIVYETPRGNLEKTLKGYMSRNMEIAKACDVLYCIDPKSRRSGGRWTMDYAKKLGKEVHLIEMGR